METNFERIICHSFFQFKRGTDDTERDLPQDITTIDATDKNTSLS